MSPKHVAVPSPAAARPFNCCLARGQRGVEGSSPRGGDGYRASPRHFSKRPMSDYLRAPLIIQRDLNLPSMLQFDGFAHSLSVRLFACQTWADNLRAICCVCKVKHARRGHDGAAGAGA